MESLPRFMAWQPAGAFRGLRGDLGAERGPRCQACRHGRDPPLEAFADHAHAFGERARSITGLASTVLSSLTDEHDTAGLVVRDRGIRHSQGFVWCAADQPGRGRLARQIDRSLLGMTARLWRTWRSDYRGRLSIKSHLASCEGLVSPVSVPEPYWPYRGELGRVPRDPTACCLR